MPSNWPEVIKQASQSQLGILALMILVLAVLALTFFRKAGSGVKLVIFILALIGVALYAKAINDVAHGDGVYRVRVVLVYQGTPVENGHVWSSLGGEAKKVSAGWEFDIPPATLPADKKLEIYAKDDPRFLQGQTNLTLAGDMNPRITIELQRKETEIRGSVQDDKGTSISGAQVQVVGYASEEASTDKGGGFVLKAHAADGQQVSLHVEATCCEPSTDYYLAGASGVVIRLKRKHK